jgi:DNA replication and repair protein RecF
VIDPAPTRIDRLWLRDFRSYPEVELALAPGLTFVTGPNGSGKSNVLEAVGYLASQRSFRGHPTEALVRTGVDRGIVRAEGVAGERSLLFEVEIVPGGRGKFLVNRQPLRRSRDLSTMIRTSVFSPDDLILVKGGPGERRLYLDDVLAAVHPRYSARQDDLEKVLKQRNALLKQIGGRLDDGAAFTLDVYDAKLAEIGTAVANSRVRLLERLSVEIDLAYGLIADSAAGSTVAVSAMYDAPWREVSGGLQQALLEGRTDDVRRGLSLVGPHRDDVSLRIDGRPSRTHASQGEQRTLALAMRLAAHRLLTAETGSPPILLLDDVFSELDPDRSAALVRHLPVGQALLASAQPPPPGIAVESVMYVARGGRGGRVAPDPGGQADEDLAFGEAVAGGTNPVPGDGVGGGVGGGVEHASSVTMGTFTRTSVDISVETVDESASESLEIHEDSSQIMTGSANDSAPTVTR